MVPAAEDSDFRRGWRAGGCARNVLAVGAGDGAIADREAGNVRGAAFVERQTGVQRRLEDDRGLGDVGGAAHDVRAGEKSIHQDLLGHIAKIGECAE